MTMNTYDLSMAHSLLDHMLPAAAIALVACAGWYVLCRWLFRADAREHERSLREPVGYAAATLEQKQMILIRQRAIAGRGSKADRVFITGMVVATVAALGWLALHL